jgi:hypothetical protein
MKQLRTSPGGRTVRGIFMRPSRQGFALFALTIMLGIVTWMPNLSTPALGQNECLLDCQQQYQACLNQPHPPMSCEDAYSACADACIGW